MAHRLADGHPPGRAPGPPSRTAAPARPHEPEPPAQRLRRARHGNRPGLRAHRPRRLKVVIRDATERDWPQIWPFLRQIVRAGETYAYDPDMDEPTARELWLVRPPRRGVGAGDRNRRVPGGGDRHP